MDKTRQDIKDIVTKLEYTLYDIVYEKREEGHVLSVQIDKETGIDIDDCVIVSEAVSLYLDEADPIKDSYSLEVTSAGAERLLRDMEEITDAIGSFVYVKTFDQQYTGTLEIVTEASIEIREKNKPKTKTIFMADIQLIRLAIDF